MTDHRAELGHVHVKVSDLDRAVSFYTRFLGLEETERVEGKKGSFAFLTAGERHHDLALQHSAWSREPREEEGTVRGSPVAGVGLYHIAFEVSGREALALALFDLVRAEVPVTAVDHGISWALYFGDPDGNGVEVYWDRRQEGREHWSGESRLLPLDEILTPAMLKELAASRAPGPEEADDGSQADDGAVAEAPAGAKEDAPGDGEEAGAG